MHYQVHKDPDGYWYVGTIKDDDEVLAYAQCESWAHAMGTLAAEMRKYGDMK